MPSPVLPRPVLVVKMETIMTEGVAFNTFYGAVTGTMSTYADVLTVANAVAVAFYPKLAACLTADCVVGGLQARWLTLTADITAFASTASVTGSVLGDSLPIQDCFEIRKITGLAGRTNVGRWFFSGMGDQDTEFGKVKSVRWPAVDALATTLATTLSAGDKTVTWKHWSRKTTVLENIVQTYGVQRLVSRRDRAKRERYLPIP